jgi:hypothetical protein
MFRAYQVGNLPIGAIPRAPRSDDRPRDAAGEDDREVDRPDAVEAKAPHDQRREEPRDSRREGDVDDGVDHLFATAHRRSPSSLRRGHHTLPFA